MTESAPTDAAPSSNPRLAVIGCGYWGINYVRVLTEVHDVDLVAICEPRAERLREVSARFPGAVPVSELDDLLARDDIDAVVVATSATTHDTVARRCLEAGLHVLVEKPIATRAVDGDQLVRIADERGVVLMVGHTFLYNPAVQQLKAYVDDGSLGRIYYLYARRTNLGPVRHDVNALWDLAPHDVSIFNHLLGAAPEWVSATGAGLLRSDLEDVGFVTLGYPGGIVGNIHVSWIDPNKVRELVVVGSSRRVVFDDISATEPIRIFEKGVRRDDDSDEAAAGFPLQIRDGDIVSPKIVPSEPLKNQVRHFLDCVRSGSRPLTPGEDGVVVVEVMEAIARSLTQRGAPVALRDSVPSVDSSRATQEVGLER